MVEFDVFVNRITINDEMKEKLGSYWGCGLSGEVGEACNLIKKHERDGIDIASYDKLGGELADSFIYLVLTAKYFGLDLESCIARKLAEGNKDEKKK